MGKRKIKEENKQDKRYNFSVIKLKTSDYIPLDKLGFVDKFLMAFRYYIDKNYKEKAMLEKQIRQEQLRSEKVFYLRRHIKNLLQTIPHDARDIKIQIDNFYLPVLEDVISSGFEEYVIEIVKMNPNYFKFVKKPHVVLKFNSIKDIF